MEPIPQTERLTIVVLGQFNPVIVTPAWLEKENLISSELARGAKLEVIHPDVSSFEIGERRVQLLRDRLVVTTADARAQETVRDLVVGILELLSHTPTSKVGLNYEAQFRMSSTEAWHAKGHLLAPKDPWKGILQAPGLLSMTMREERADGYFDVKLGPAELVKDGLLVSVNDHYELDPASADNARRLVNSKWLETLTRSRHVAVALAREDSHA